MANELLTNAARWLNIPWYGAKRAPAWETAFRPHRAVGGARAALQCVAWRGTPLPSEPAHGVLPAKSQAAHRPYMVPRVQISIVCALRRHPATGLGPPGRPAPSPRRESDLESNKQHRPALAEQARRKCCAEPACRRAQSLAHAHVQALPRAPAASGQGARRRPVSAPAALMHVHITTPHRFPHRREPTASQGVTASGVTAWAPQTARNRRAAPPLSTLRSRAACAV